MMVNEAGVMTTAALADALRRAAHEAGAAEDFEPQLERPADSTHGDVSSNVALVLAGRLHRPPLELADEIAARIDPVVAEVSSIEVAGPGFLNFRLADVVLWRGVLEVLARPDEWGRSVCRSQQLVNVEFVSANPTGPLHVAHGRGAAIGDATASLLGRAGHRVVREFYVNDAGRQIELLGESLDARFLQSQGFETELPEGGYQGEYVVELVEHIAGEEGAERLAVMETEERRALFASRASSILRREQELDLLEFGVRMDVFFDESGLFSRGEVEELLARLEESGHTYRESGALWLRTTDFGDEKDRVLVKSDGSHTYLVSDIAYHVDKARRDFDLAIDVWGADHHGHVPRMQAALTALGEPEGFLEVLLIQLVTVMRGGAEVRMSKRAGRFVPLRELLEEIGADVTRYFFLMRKAEVPMTFDLDLALDTSEANPVYKVQYAHARMCSVFEKGGLEPEGIRATIGDLELLDAASERLVAKTLLRFPERVAAAGEARAPYQICQYLEELAGAVNAWYHEGNLDPERRVLADVPARPARLTLARAVQITLRNGLTLLGISVPSTMLREAGE
jgi:arginyl-tRNA synthetase